MPTLSRPTYRLDYLGTVHIPAQYKLDAGLHYWFRQTAEIRLDGYNVTDRKNWSPLRLYRNIIRAVAAHKERSDA